MNFVIFKTVFSDSRHILNRPSNISKDRGAFQLHVGLHNNCLQGNMCDLAREVFFGPPGRLTSNWLINELLAKPFDKYLARSLNREIR